MAKGKLFEYAVLYHPKKTKEQNERGEEPKSILLVKPTQVLSTGDQEVAMLAARALPADYVDKLEDVEVLVRPF